MLDHFRAACHAVAYAHSRGVLHRDLKPANILVGKFGETLVVDWGLAKIAGTTEATRTDAEGTLTAAYEAHGEATALGQAVGTPAFMSPEQAAGRWNVVGPESDVYSLGATLYYLLTGKVPFTGADHAEVLAKVQRGEFTPPRQVRPQVPRGLEAVCLQAMALKPEQRYATAAALAADVEHWLADEPVTAYREPVLLRLARWGRRHRAAMAGVAGLLVMAVVGLAGGLAAVERERLQTAHERDDKERALQAEMAARRETADAVRRVRQALARVSDQAIEEALGREGRLTEPQKEFLRGMLKEFEEFAATRGDTAEAREIRAEGHDRVGGVRYRLGELKEAEANYREALALRNQLAADFPTRPDFRQILATSHNHLGLLLRETSRPKEAEQAFQDALTLQKQLVADFPTQPEFRQELAVSHYNLGRLLRDTGRLGEAEAAFHDARTLQERLAADFPTRPEFRHELTRIHNNLGHVFELTARLKEAEATYRYVVTLQEQLVAEFPTRPEFRQELAKYHNNLGIVFQSTLRLQEAEAPYREALRLWKQLAADFPTRHDLRRNLAISHHNLGNLFRNTRRLDEAERFYHDALTLQKPLAADFPKMSDYRSELAASLVGLAEVLQDRRDFAAARQLLEEAQPHHQAGLQANPRDPQYRYYYRWNLSVLVPTLAGLRDPASALRTAGKLRDLGWDAADDAYEATLGLAKCIPIVGKDEQLSPEERQRQTLLFANQALAMLRHAIDKGYKDVAQLKQDKDLDPVRQREDFQNLLAELDARSRLKEETTKDTNNTKKN
jgi:serine/threonine-protein kinase